MNTHNLQPAGRYSDLPTNASELAQAFFSRDVCAMSERLGENRIKTKPGGIQMTIPVNAAFPVLAHNRVTHIGSLNKTLKQPNSYEGAGLSVSLHPHAWQRIAKLGGNEWHRLSKPGAKFLDRHALTPDQQHTITQWGIKHGYVETATVYFHSWDDEFGEPSIIESADRREIEAELEDDETVQVKTGIRALPKLHTESMNTNIPPFLAFDLLATVYAEHVLAFDGVWWEDTLDPDNLSAPRGAINQTQLDSWTATKDT